jgi:hypothetical protein
LLFARQHTYNAAAAKVGKFLMVRGNKQFFPLKTFLAKYFLSGGKTTLAKTVFLQFLLDAKSSFFHV